MRLRLLHRLSATEAQISLVLSEPACVALAAETEIKLNAHSPTCESLLGDDEAVLSRVTVYNRATSARRLLLFAAPRRPGDIPVPWARWGAWRMALRRFNLPRGGCDNSKSGANCFLSHTRNAAVLDSPEKHDGCHRAGALVMHACPHFYHRPQSVQDVVDTVDRSRARSTGVDVQTRRWME
jgi:hypothetical protein